MWFRFQGALGSEGLVSCPSLDNPLQSYLHPLLVAGVGECTHDTVLAEDTGKKAGNILLGFIMDTGSTFPVRG